MTKKLIIPIIALALAGVLAYGTGNALADETSFVHPVATKLAEKFGLDEEEVNAFFSEVREERGSRRHTLRDGRLDTLVADGVLTEEQKTLIQTKHEEMQEEGERGVHGEEMHAWAEENGIDMGALKANHMGKEKGFRGLNR